MFTYDHFIELHNWLTENWSGYVSIIEGGSTSAGDPIILGRSDWEVAIVADNISEKDRISLATYLRSFPQDDRLELVYRSKEELLGNSQSSHQLTGKFRSKTLFGEDLLDQIPLPDVSIIEKAWRSGLKMTIYKIDKYTVNASIWSDERIRKAFRQVFKDAFLNLQLKSWCDTENFPVTRKDVVLAYSSPELADVWDCLHGINDANPDVILETAKRLKLLLSEIA